MEAHGKLPVVRVPVEAETRTLGASASSSPRAQPRPTQRSAVHQLRIDAGPNAIHNRTLKTHDRRAPHAAKPEATRGDRHLQCTPRIAGSTSELVRASTRRGSGEEASGRPAKGGGIVAGAWLTIQYILWCWETARSTSGNKLGGIRRPAVVRGEALRPLAVELSVEIQRGNA